MASDSITTASSTAQYTARRATTMPRPAATEITASTQNAAAAPAEVAGPAASRCAAVTGPPRSRPGPAGRPEPSPPRTPRPAPAGQPGPPGHAEPRPSRAGSSRARYPQPHRVRRHLHAGLQRRQQLLLGPDQVLPAIVGELVLIRHGQRTGRARLHTQPAQDAAQVIDLIHRPIPLTRGEPLLRGVVPALHIDGIRRAGPRAQLAANALLQPIRPAVELVTAVEPRRGGPFLLRVGNRIDLPEHLPESHTEPLDRVEELKHR